MVSNVLIIIIYNIALTNLNFGTWINISSVISFCALVITLLLMYLPKLILDTKKIGIEPHDIIYEKDENSDHDIDNQLDNHRNYDSKDDEIPTASYTNTNTNENLLYSRSGENVLNSRSGENVLNSRSGENVLNSRSGENVLNSRSGENVLNSRSGGDCSMMTIRDVYMHSKDIDDLHES